jgi:hypothetical protein
VPSVPAELTAQDEEQMECLLFDLIVEKNKLLDQMAEDND